MKKIIIATLILVAITIGFVNSEGATNCEGNYILIELEYNQTNPSEFILINKTIEIGCKPQNQYDPDKQYSYTIKNSDGEIEKYSFSPSLIFTDIQEGETLEGGTIEPTNEKIFLTINSKNSETLEIYKEGTKIFETTVFDAGAKSCRTN